MKKIVMTLILLLSFTGIVFANGNNEAAEGSETKKVEVKIGMVTDAGTIDDKSFNQGTWEGILRAGDELGVMRDEEVSPHSLFIFVSFILYPEFKLLVIWLWGVSKQLLHHSFRITFLCKPVIRRDAWSIQSNSSADSGAKPKLTAIKY